MKLLSFCGAIAVAAIVLPSATHAASGKGKPGFCVDDTDCAKTYTCVSVQTTRDGVENVKQCLPTAAGSPVCTGIVPGLCPSFSTTWGTNFRQISSVCAYILPEGKGIKCIGDASAAATTSGATTTNSTAKGAVECLFIENPANKTQQIGVIYGCVDFDGKRLLFDKESKSNTLSAKSNYSEIVPKYCVNPKNPQGSTFVCSSQGTCSPNSPSTFEYSCKCNIGFSGKFCEKIVNNKCYNDGVCGGGSCDLAKNECTNCLAGTLGNKCAQCDPTFDAAKVCNGHGKCVSSTGDSTLGGDSTSPGTVSASNATNASRFLAEAMYQCQCDTGYSDVHCNVKLKPSKSSSPKTTEAPGAASVSAATITASITAVVLTIAAVFSA